MYQSGIAATVEFASFAGLPTNWATILDTPQLHLPPIRHPTMALDLFRFFRPTQRERTGTHSNVHMTWQSRSVSRTVARTRVLLTTQIWIWPIIALLVLGSIGYFTKRMIESTIKSSLMAELKAFVEIESQMIESWRRVQLSNAEALASSLAVRGVVYKMLAAETASGEGAPIDAAIRLELKKQLAPAMTSHHYEGYFVVDRTYRILDASNPVLVGQRNIPEYSKTLGICFEGDTALSPPFASVVMLPDEKGVSRAGTPTMIVSAPIRDESFQVIGAIVFRIAPNREFTRILQMGQLGKTGESYAFDSEGLMVSNSRFDEQLILLGILPDRENSKSILNVSLRDPGGDLSSGYRPKVRRSSSPFTRSVADALAGNAGADVDGFRDYRGKLVVAAWKWLPEFGIGITTEIEAAEAFRPLIILRNTFFVLFGLLGVTSIGIFAFTVMTARLRREAQQAAMKAQQLGQYRLEEKLGAGAMGVVYKGHHAMLRRPAAVKMLELDKMNDEAQARFEREVQITCQLNHPNTISIYDYGRTPEGIFYYAMEYIEGINLQTLVSQDGPLSEERVIHLLRQICGSLFEAHSMGLVHRDVKPANIMLSRRGCEPDVIKVLDFGLVKEVANDDGKGARNSLTGTPLYMSPEAFQSPLSVDACSDLYAVGAVGYYLLTGRPVFEADSIVALCKKHVDEDPEPPSKYCSAPVSPELEHAILSCLEKKRPKRPQTARDLSQLLNRSPKAFIWTNEKGEEWWSRHERAHKGKNADSSAPTEVASLLDRTIEHSN